MAVQVGVVWDPNLEELLKGTSCSKTLRVKGKQHEEGTKEEERSRKEKAVCLATRSKWTSASSAAWIMRRSRGTGNPEGTADKTGRPHGT